MPDGDGVAKDDRDQSMKRQACVFCICVLLSSVIVVLLLNGKQFKTRTILRRPPQDIGTENDRGYAVTLTYGGQQGAGIRALVSQQCWIDSIVNERYRSNHIQVYLLEPLLESTSFVSGTNAVADRKTALPFGNFYDMEQLNQASVRLGLGQMVTIGDFFKNAPRKITLLLFDFSVSTTKVVWTAQNDSNCYDKYKGKDLSSLIREGFCIIQVIQAPISKSRQRRFRNYSDYIFDDHSEHVLFEKWDPLQSVLVINFWRERWVAPVDTVPTNTQLSQHLSDSSRCKYSDLENVREHLIPSPSLLKDATMYKKTYLNVTSSHVKTVAVMFRSEHLISSEGVCKKVTDSVKNCIEHCLQEAVDVTKSLLKQDYFSSHPFLTHDIGPYGSQSIQRVVGHYSKTKLTRDFLDESMKTAMLQLFGHAWTLADLEKSYSEISENEGYIAALQRNIASDADCLVLVGGGNFQDLTLHDYIRKHPNVKGRCVHFICAYNEDILQSVMSKGY